MGRSRILARGAAWWLAVAVPLAAAQEALPTVPVDPASAQPTPLQRENQVVELEEVVVTAQKRTQSLQKVPVSVGVVGGEALAQSGNFDAGALENFIPNVEIDIDPQAPVIGIRGFATETDNVGFEPSVGLVMDDLALGRPEFIPDGLFDIERIEVLRGSQGTLFGKNTIAGVINFRSYEAEPAFGANLALTAGDPEQWRAEGMLNAPLGEDYAARAAGVYWEKEGDVYNSTLDRYENTLEQQALRLKLAAAPGERWNLSLSGQYSDTRVDYAPWQLFEATDAALSYARSFDAEAEDDGLDAHTTFDVPGYTDRQSNLVRVLAEYDAGDIVTTAVVGHAGFDLGVIIDGDVSASDIVTTDFRVDYRQDSIELRPSGSSDSLFGLLGEVEWTVGVYAYQAELESHLDTLAGDNLVDFALSSAGFDTLGLDGLQFLAAILDRLPNFEIPIDDRLLRGFEQETESYAAFGQMNWHLNRRLQAILGLRVGVEDKRAEFDTRTVGPGLIALVLGAESFTTSRERSETDVSPKLGLQYEWSRDVMSFLSFTRGFKGGGFNATANDDTNLEFEPEKSSGWELGVKSRLFERALTLNATLYRTDIRNLQTVDFDGLVFQISNAAEARLQGAEIEASWQPGVDWFSLAAALAISDAEYVEYRDAPAAAEAEDDPATADVDESERQDLSGRTLANAPDLTATLSPTLSFALPHDLGLKLGVDLSYRGEQYSATDLDSHSFQQGYTLVGARLLLAPGSERWAFVVNGNNLTDERALDLVFDHSVFADSYVAQQIPLRSVSATLRVNF